MRKKEYISPVCNVIKMTSIVLQSTSPNLLIDPDTTTGDALAPFLETDDF